MAKPDKKKNKSASSGTVAAIGLLAAGAVAAGAAFMASRRQQEAGDGLVDAGDTFDAADDIDLDDASVAAVQTIPVAEPMQYTGDGTPDMAVSYTPGLTDTDTGDGVAIGTAEQRDTLAGVNA